MGFILFDSGGNGTECVWDVHGKGGFDLSEI